MIPIECPKCGRSGNVPPDRLNARMVCKACHSVFHMDTSGRMVLGEHSDPAKPQRSRAPVAAADFDLAETWRDIPAPVKVGVPAFVLAFLLWQFNPFGGGGPAYQGRAEEVIRALACNDRARALSFATASTAEKAGKWFDLLHDQVEQKKVGTDYSLSVTIFSGDPGKGDTTLTLWGILYNNELGSESTVPVNIIMTLDNGTWKLDGDKTLEEGAKSLPTMTASKKG